MYRFFSPFVSMIGIWTDAVFFWRSVIIQVQELHVVGIGDKLQYMEWKSSSQATMPPKIQENSSSNSVLIGRLVIAQTGSKFLRIILNQRIIPWKSFHFLQVPLLFCLWGGIIAKSIIFVGEVILQVTYSSHNQINFVTN